MFIFACTKYSSASNFDACMLLLIIILNFDNPAGQEKLTQLTLLFQTLHMFFGLFFLDMIVGVVSASL